MAINFPARPPPLLPHRRRHQSWLPGPVPPPTPTPGPDSVPLPGPLRVPNVQPPRGRLEGWLAGRFSIFYEGDPEVELPLSHPTGSSSFTMPPGAAQRPLLQRQCGGRIVNPSSTIMPCEPTPHTRRAITAPNFPSPAARPSPHRSQPSNWKFQEVSVLLRPPRGPLPSGWPTRFNVCKPPPGMRLYGRFLVQCHLPAPLRHHQATRP